MPIYRQRPKEARLSIIGPRADGVTENRNGSVIGVVTTRASELCRPAGRAASIEPRAERPQPITRDGNGCAL
jgi:hypothetical protein